MVDLLDRHDSRHTHTKTVRVLILCEYRKARKGYQPISIENHKELLYCCNTNVEQMDKFA